MKRLTCEMCGSTDLIKQEGVFVCQSCGCKYSVEEARKMMIEGTVEVTGTVKVDNTAAIINYLEMARNAADAQNYEEAENYCNRVIEMDVSNWEAWFIKGKSVGWQSTLSNVRIAETVNAFSKAISNCPADKKDNVISECCASIEDMNNALLSIRVGNFKQVPNENDLTGLQTDIYTILNACSDFESKNGIATPKTTFLRFGRTINNGLCDAWGKVYSEFKNDNDGYPSDYAFTSFISEADCILGGFEKSLVFFGEDYDNQEVNDLLIQIYKNMIDIQENIIDANSYDVSFNDGYTSHYKSKSLTKDAKQLRKNEINDWNSQIKKIETEGPAIIAEKAKKEEEEKRKKKEEAERIQRQ